MAAKVNNCRQKRARNAIKMRQNKHFPSFFCRKKEKKLRNDGPAVGYSTRERAQNGSSPPPISSFTIVVRSSFCHDAYCACSLNQSLYRKHEAVASCCISNFIEFGTIKIQIVFRVLLSLFSHCSQDNVLLSLLGEWCQERHRSFFCV